MTFKQIKYTTSFSICKGFPRHILAQAIALWAAPAEELDAWLEVLTLLEMLK